MSTIKNQKPLTLILIFCIFALITAYFIEYVLGHQPCNLCLIERIPYVTAIIIISSCLFFKRFEKISLVILIFIFFIAMLISFYHFGIERGFIEESLVCDLSVSGEILTKEALLDQLKVRTISCKDITFKIFGMSLSTINIIISLLLSLINIKLFLNYEKNK
jgi:disulfide bond formation protein DsbB|tara:strand:- start:416 stop:901 length:486 start_codon:yes stop_codon:yes gene_type:complete